MNSYYVAILQGSVLTVGVSLCALLVSIVLGLLGAAVEPSLCVLRWSMTPWVPHKLRNHVKCSMA